MRFFVDLRQAYRLSVSAAGVGWMAGGSLGYLTVTYNWGFWRVMLVGFATWIATRIIIRLLWRNTPIIVEADNVPEDGSHS